MGFNYGYEKKKFDSRWKRLEVEYCDAGMHTAVASGSWCGAERQRCGASGSPLM